MKIKDISKVDLPREKILKYGVKKLTDFELLALMLGSGIKGLNVLELSKKILKLIKKIGISNITIEKLLEIKGLGSVKASEILAVLEFSKRINKKDKLSLLSPKDVWTICSDFFDSKREHLAVCYIDSQNKLIERKIVSIGILNATMVHPREVFEPAISLLASSIILVHNHPSGDIKPSTEDKNITKMIFEAGKILGILLSDHIIVSPSSYFSFKEDGLL